VSISQPAAHFFGTEGQRSDLFMTGISRSERLLAKGVITTNMKPNSRTYNFVSRQDLDNSQT
jgi:hypothetical protein